MSNSYCHYPTWKLTTSEDSLLFNQRDGPEGVGDGTSLRYDKKGKGRAQHNEDILAMDLISAEEGSPNQNGGAFMQMQLMEQQVSEVGHE